MNAIDLTTITMIPTQQGLKQCVGRRFIGVIDRSKNRTSFMTKYDSGKEIIKLEGSFYPTNKE